ncbi:TPA: hypothetical protein HA278_00550 [Candidatus Woesearchaeota archaeon]|jgi:hypothetical protein|nr:hypothetical protein [Candidatus Woesearchaeota archaeon]|tara:strand:+ start:1242 stop:1412 length:171 start_codon:yes stop_codon:yes gene_type:complete
MSTEDIINALRNDNLDAARSETQNILYQKTGEYVQNKKNEISANITKTDISATDEE